MPDSVHIHEYSGDHPAAVFALYESVGWKNYTSHPEMLENAYRHSLKALAAWRGDRLVGIIRAVGDGCSILYIQDIIVLPQYQGRGIGKALLQAMDALYPKVYQKVLLTDETQKTLAFYQSCGFSPSSSFGCTALVKFTAQNEG